MAVAEASAGAQDGWRLFTSFMKWFRYALLGVSSPRFAQGLQAEELEGVVAGTVVVTVELSPGMEVEEGVLLELVGALGLPLGGRGVTTTPDGRGPPVSPPVVAAAAVLAAPPLINV